MAEPVCSVNDRRLIGVIESGKTTVGLDLTKLLGGKFCADNVESFLFTNHVNDLVRGDGRVRAACSTAGMFPLPSPSNDVRSSPGSLRGLRMRKYLSLVLLIMLTATMIPHAYSQDQDDLIDPDPQPRWFKGNLHTHSLWSDGNDYPEMIVDWYRQHRYQFLALSDHNILSQGQKWMNIKQANQRAGEDGFARYRKRFGDAWVETRTVNGEFQVRLKPLNEFRSLFERAGSFLLIQGEEITDHFEAKPIHMNASNLLELIKPQGGKSVVETMANNLAAVEAQSRRLGRPILTHLNHPNFGYAITAEELAMVTKERFFEIYNGHSDVHHQGDETHASVERMWDIINTLRIGEMGVPPVNGLATDDSHNYFGKRGSSPGRGWIMVRARHLTPESIIKGIEARDYYASSGVTLRHVGFSPQSRVLELQIEPQGKARYTTRFIGTLRGYDPTRKPVLDKDGKPLPLTKRYSEDVGGSWRRMRARSLATN